MVNFEAFTPSLNVQVTMNDHIAVEIRSETVTTAYAVHADAGGGLAVRAGAGASSTDTAGAVMGASPHGPATVTTPNKWTCHLCSLLPSAQPPADCSCA